MRPLLRKHFRLPVLSLALLALVLVAATPTQAQTTFTVTNTNDSGAGSLRQAILDANANAGADVIAFNIGSGGAQTITLSSPLPVLTDVVTIDGSSQPGFSGTPLIDIDANNLGGTILGVSADNTTLNDFKISNASGNALSLANVDNATIANLDLSFSGPSRSGTGLELSGNNITIENVTATNRQTAFYIPFGGSDIRVLNNDLSNSGLSLYMYSISADVLPGGVEMRGNDFTGSSSGVILGFMSDLTISDGSVPGTNVDLSDQLGNQTLPTTTGTALFLSNVDNATIASLDLSFSGPSRSGTGLSLRGDNVTIENVTATNRQTAFYISGGSDIRVLNNDLSNSGLSLRMENISVDVLPGGVEVRGNDFTGSSSGVSLGFMSDLTISDGSVPGTNVDLSDQLGNQTLPTTTGTALYLGVDNATIASLDLSFSGPSRSGTGLSLRGNNITIENVTATNRQTAFDIPFGGSDIRVLNNDLSNSGLSLYMYNISAGALPGGVEVRGNDFTGSSSGVSLYSMSDLTISDGSVPGTNVDLTDQLGNQTLTTATGFALALGVDNATIANLDLSFSGPSRSGTGLEIGGDNVTIENVAATNRQSAFSIHGSDIRVLNNDLSNSGQSLSMSNISADVLPGGVEVRGNDYTGSSSGVFLQGMSDLTISDGSVPGTNVDLTDQLGNQTLPTTGTSFGTALFLHNVDNATIANLDLSFSGPSRSGTGLSLSGNNVTIENVAATNRQTAFSISGSDIRVLNNDLSNSGQSLSMSNISADVLPGGVEVRGNDYTGSSSGVFLQGMSDLTISDGSVPGTNVDLTDQLGNQTLPTTGTLFDTALFLNFVDNATIANLDLSFSGPSRSGTGLRINCCDNVTIENVAATNRQTAFDIGFVSDIRVLNNDLSNSGQSLSMSGISAGALPGGVEVRGNDYTGSSSGVFLQGMSDLTISDGSVPGTNVDLTDQLGNQTLPTTTFFALYLGVDNATIANLDLSFSGPSRSGTGLEIDGNNVTIENVTATNRQTAFSISGGINVTASCLSILNNHTGVSVNPFFGNATGVVLFDNHIEGNNTGVSNGASDPLVNAVNNFWGAADGPSNLGGSGDSFIGNVVASPFLTSVPACVNGLGIFRVSSIFPTEGGDTGTVSAFIHGELFETGATVRLEGPGGIIVGDPVIVSANGGTLSTAFDLTGRAHDLYDVVVTNPDSATATLAGAFTIIAGPPILPGPGGIQPDQLSTDIVGRTAIRTGRAQSFTIAYRNRENVDLGAPLLTLSNEEDVEFSFSSDQPFRASPLRLFAAGRPGFAGRLNPGVTNAFNALVRTSETSGNVTLELQFVDTEGRLFDWDLLAAEGVPPGSTPEDWEEMVALARSRVGESWDDVLSVYRMVGDMALDPNFLIDFDEMLFYLVAILGSNPEDFDARASKRAPSPRSVAKPNFDPSDVILLVCTENDCVEGGEVIEDPDLNIYVAHGQGGIGDEHFDFGKALKGSEELKALFPKVNVFQIDWSSNSKSMFLGGAPCPWCITLSGNIQISAFQAWLRARALPGSDPAKTIGIGISFGVPLIDKMSVLFGGFEGIVALHPSSEGSLYFLDKLSGNHTTSFHSDSEFDSQKKIANFSVGVKGSVGASQAELHRATLISFTDMLQNEDPVVRQRAVDMITSNFPFEASGNPSLFDGTFNAEEDGLYTPEPVPNRTQKRLRDALFALFGPLIHVLINNHDIEVVGSLDPNEKTGPQGIGEARYHTGEQPLQYAIFFENVETATAPAQEVVITDQLDPTKVDFSTSSLGLITFGDRQVVPPPGLQSFTTDVDIRPDQDLIVRIEADLNPSTGLLTWHFSSLDPETGLPTDDPLAGFLPPNANPPEGDGSVLFSVMPLPGLATGTQIENQATIVFDVNPPIDTPVWLNTLDNTAPTSQVAPLDSLQVDPSFVIQWGGSDDGSGIQDFTIFVSDDGRPFIPWLVETTDTTATYAGTLGKRYAFYSIARDSVGHLEEVPPVADATTTVATVVSVAEGWNMVGLPVSVADASVEVLCPNALAGTLFGFDGVYIVEDTLVLGNGYWLRFPVAEVVPFAGSLVQEVTVSLAEHWNMISGPSCGVPLASVSDPDNIIIDGTLFGFEGVYFQSNTLEPGQGYWLRASAAGQITLTCSGAALAKEQRPESAPGLMRFGRLLLSDASGAQQTLYFSPGLPEGVDARSYSLPPVPPPGVFDVRFSDSTRLTGDAEAVIRVQASQYPLVIRVAKLPEGTSYRYMVQELVAEGEGAVYALEPGRSIEITGTGVEALKLVHASEELPAEFVLDQNYPNPFNPKTTIRYGLPEAAKVQVEIYNLLGQRVAVLVSEQQDAGYHRVVWDGSNAASGVYFYIVQASDKREVKKMLLIK